MSRFAAAVVGLGLAFLPAVSWAESPYAMSNEASLSGGAVLAHGREIGSLWYNPAVLGGVSRAETEVNGEAFGGRWSNARTGAVVPTADGSRVERLESSETLVVSSTFALAFALSPRWALGVGVFSPLSGDAILEDGGESDDLYVRTRRTSQRSHYGVAVGWQPAARLRLGASLLGVYDELSTRYRVYSSLGPGASLSLDNESTTVSHGLMAKLGAAAQVHPWVRLGATIETPAFVLARSREGVRAVTRVEDGAALSDFERVADDEVQGSTLTGWRGAVGVSVARGIWRFAADLYASGPSAGMDQPGYGARVGATFDLSDRFVLGAGAFADRNTASDAGAAAFQGDRWGTSLGLEFREPIRLARGESARSLEFRTTLAVRYAYEVGTRGGVRVVDGIRLDTQSARSGALNHLLLIHFGTSLAF